MSGRYDRKSYRNDRDRPSSKATIDKARADLDKIFGDVYAQPAPSSKASGFTRYVHDRMSGKTLCLPISNVRIETQGETVALRLDTLNGGQPLTLILDHKFWRHTLSLLTDAKLLLEDGRVFLRYASVSGITHRDIEDQWLGNLITGRVQDYHSVRAKAGESIINYRRAALEVRQDATQKVENEQLKVAAAFNTQNPTYPMEIGNHTVALGGTAQETAGNVNPDKPAQGKVVGVFKNGDAPKVTRFGRRVRAGHERRAGVNKGKYDQLQSLTDALVAVPTETRDSGIGNQSVS